MKVLLERMTLTNFRGVRSLTVDFDTNTTIYGDNRTGKTTIYNAFLWLLFGKDNQDRKDFEIKTLGPNNEPYHRLDHEVSAILQINGEHTSLKRTYREKWVKKKGNTEAEFTGHETLLFWNDVPYKLEDFQSKVNSILKENVFKMITSTGYFNSMKWQERRAILLELAGNIQDLNLLQSISEKQGGKFDALIKALTGKTLDEYKREVANKKRKIREELDMMPARIDEANRSLPEEKDYTSLLTEKQSLEESLQLIEGELMNKTSAQKQRQNALSTKIKKVGDLRVDLNGIEFHIKNSVRDKRQQREQDILNFKRELQTLNDNFTRLGISIKTETDRKTRLEAEKAELTAKWHKINNEQLVFDETKFACPTCKRAYEASGIEEKKIELTKNFNQNKSSRLAEITDNGKRIAAELKLIEVKISGFDSEKDGLLLQIKNRQEVIDSLQEKHNLFTANEEAAVLNDIKENGRHKEITAQIQALEEEINAPQDMEENQGVLIQQKKDISTKIANINNELSTKGQREKALARIAELTTSESKMANELADFEKIEFSIYEYTKAKMDEMESRINDRFRMVRFKMFRDQVNGGQEECCETLIDGVPFGVANTASQINAGLDIINVMSDHFNIHAPVFVDNRESVVTLIPSGSQIINLVVVKGAALSVNEIRYRKDYQPESNLAVA